MNNEKRNFIEGIDTDFKWYNEPKAYSYDNDGLTIQTKPFTDFWQKTHYRFQRDDGHCFITEKEGDFSFTAHVAFSSKKMYDQCGIILKIDTFNWVKASIEYENDQISRLGSVVTNLDYSDWATTDISSNVDNMWYRLSKNGKDILLENSYDGNDWNQMRILHMHKTFEKALVGVYACSPKKSSFECKVTKMIMGENTWSYDE